MGPPQEGFWEVSHLATQTQHLIVLLLSESSHASVILDALLTHHALAGSIHLLGDLEDLAVLQDLSNLVLLGF